MVTIWVLLLFGALLLLLETFLPGGIAGIAGLALLIAAVVMAYLNHGAAVGNLVFLAVLILMAVGAVAWLKFFPKSRLGQVFVSQSHVGNAGYTYDNLLHQTGVTRTPLRPSGMAEIAGQRYDVVAEGTFVEQDRPVKVVQVEGNRIVVRSAAGS